MQLLAGCEVPVVRPPLSSNRLGQLAVIYFVVGITYFIVRLGNWTLRAEIIAFYAGFGGTIWLF